MTRAGERWAWKTTLTLADGTRKQVMKRGFETKKAALASLRDALAESGKTGYSEPSRQPTGEYLATWLDSLRLAPSTVASYRKNVRLHIAPNIGSIPLASLTPVTLDRLYRQLEADGRADHREGEGLSPRTVRYVHTIVSAALRAAVDAGLITSNPASRAHPPTARQAASPEMHPWTENQLASVKHHRVAIPGEGEAGRSASRAHDADGHGGLLAVARGSRRAPQRDVREGADGGLGVGLVRGLRPVDGQPRGQQGVRFRGRQRHRARPRPLAGAGAIHHAHLHLRLRRLAHRSCNRSASSRIPG
jgi:hypothetical protein